MDQHQNECDAIGNYKLWNLRMDNMHEYGKSWRKFKKKFRIEINGKLQFWEYVSMYNLENHKDKIAFREGIFFKSVTNFKNKLGTFFVF